MLSIDAQFLALLQPIVPSMAGATDEAEAGLVDATAWIASSSALTSCATAVGAPSRVPSLELALVDDIIITLANIASIGPTTEALGATTRQTARRARGVVRGHPVWRAHCPEVVRFAGEDCPEVVRFR